MIKSSLSECYFFQLSVSTATALSPFLDARTTHWLCVILPEAPPPLLSQHPSLHGETCWHNRWRWQTENLWRHFVEGSKLFKCIYICTFVPCEK